MVDGMRDTALSRFIHWSVWHFINKGEVKMQGMENSTIEHVKQLGFDVYHPEKLSSYFWAVTADGKDFCYIQLNYWGQFSVSSVCTPSEFTGTGEQVADGLTELTLDVITKACTHRYGKKYPDFEAFLAKHWQQFVKA
jgi:hypothetical protein